VSAGSSSNTIHNEDNRTTRKVSAGAASVDAHVVPHQQLTEPMPSDLRDARDSLLSTTAKDVPPEDRASEQTMTAGNDKTGLDPTMMAQQLHDSHRTSDLANAAEKQPLGRRKVDAAKDSQSELAKASTAEPSARRSTRGSAHSLAISVVSNTATSPHLSKQLASNAKSEPHDKGASRTQVSDDPAFAGVFEVERLLEKQWSGKILWLKIKWKGIPTGSWEKAEHMKADLGEEAYQELLETKPRKRRKKTGKW
jgi:hypothetical protein